MKGKQLRILILDAARHLQMVCPIVGSLSDAIVAGMLKAAAVPCPPSVSSNSKARRP